MSGLNIVRLGDFAEFVRGINFKPEDVVSVGAPGTVACMRTKNVQAELDLSDVWAVDKSFMRRDNQLLQKGDILVSSANSWNLVGKCSWIPALPYQATFGGFVSVLRASSKNLDPRYLYRWFSSNHVQETLRSFGQKTTNISNLNLGRCEELSFPLPPLPEQRRIAAILDQAETLRTQRRAALAQLDSLAQSLFLDMFGDPARNTLCLPMVALDDLGKWHSGGTPPRGSGHYFEGDIPWFSSGELDSMYVSNSSEHISEEAVRETSAKLVPAGALMLGMYDTAALKASIAANECSCNQAIAFSAIRPERAHTVYVYYAIVIGREHFRRLQRGVRQKNLNLSMIREIQIPSPPLPLQQTFATRIQAIEALKATHRAALAQLDALFASLQQRAFAGEL